MPRVELPYQWAPRSDQEALWRYLHNGGKRASVIAHRRWGKDDIALHFAAMAAHERIGTYWHMLPQQNQARRAIWNAVNPRTGRRRIDDAFPKEIRANTRDDEMLIRFKSGSTWQVLGSDNYDALVGAPPIGVTYSEWALSNPQAWSLVRPILAENDGWALFITTPRGRNHAYRMHMMAQDSPDWFAQLLTANDTPVLSADVLERELAELVSERGTEDGTAIYEQEYLCSWSAALPGAYYARQVDAIERGGQITQVPHNPARQVHTAWDIGSNDATVIWFLQWTGVAWAVIDHLANTNVGPEWYVAELKKRPYIYGEHLLPHDAGASNVRVANAGTMVDVLRALGLDNLRVVPRTVSLSHDIHLVRQTLPICWFDKEKCALGVDALRSYRRVWDEKLRAYKDSPLHDWSSDHADAFRTFVIGRPRDVNRVGVDEDARRPHRQRARAGI